MKLTSSFMLNFVHIYRRFPNTLQWNLQSTCKLLKHLQSRALSFGALSLLTSQTAKQLLQAPACSIQVMQGVERGGTSRLSIISTFSAATVCGTKLTANKQKMSIQFSLGSFHFVWPFLGA